MAGEEEAAAAAASSDAQKTPRCCGTPPSTHLRFAGLCSPSTPWSWSPDISRSPARCVFIIFIIVSSMRANTHTPLLLQLYRYVHDRKKISVCSPVPMYIIFFLGVRWYLRQGCLFFCGSLLVPSWYLPPWWYIHSCCAMFVLCFDFFFYVSLSRSLKAKAIHTAQTRTHIRMHTYPRAPSPPLCLLGSKVGHCAARGLDGTACATARCDHRWRRR